MDEISSPRRSARSSGRCDPPPDDSRLGEHAKQSGGNDPASTSVGFGLVANLDTAIRMRAVSRVTRSTALLANEVVGTAAVVVIVVIPWILGGLHPSREDLTWAILLSFASAFLSVCALMVSAFDISRFEAAAQQRGK